LTGYIQNPEERDAAAETIRKLEENFEGWFIVKERDRMFQLACDIPSHLRAANAIFPKIHGEYVERRLHLDKAIACCYRLQEELQFTATTLPSDYNKFTRLVLDLDHEANLIKKLRRSDERRFSDLAAELAQEPPQEPPQESTPPEKAQKTE